VNSLSEIKIEMSKMNKYKMEMNNISELLIGKEYHSTARTGYGTILEARSRGDVHFPGAYVYAVRVSMNSYDTLKRILGNCRRIRIKKCGGSVHKNGGTTVHKSCRTSSYKKDSTTTK
jgi:hypothetical protein